MEKIPRRNRKKSNRNHKDEQNQKPNQMESLPRYDPSKCKEIPTEMKQISKQTHTQEQLQTPYKKFKNSWENI